MPTCNWSRYTEPPFPTWSGMVEKMAGDCKLLVHLGDTKGGSGPCNDTLMAEPIRIMIRSGAPVLYTLGDNEATDCHRMLSRSDMTAQGGVVGSSSAAAAAMYPVAAEYLTAESARSHMISEFFSDLTTDLTGTLAVDTHSAACPFNSMVVVDHMLVATIEMPGSNFGLSVEPNMDLVDPVASHQMMYDRANACNMEWITAAAKKAADHHIKAVLIGFQAAWWDVALVGTGSKSAAARHVAYEPFLQKMLEVTAAYPDIMFYTVHADSHFWLSFSPSNIQNWVNLMVRHPFPHALWPSIMPTGPPIRRPPLCTLLRRSRVRTVRCTATPSSLTTPTPSSIRLP